MKKLPHDTGMPEPVRATFTKGFWKKRVLLNRDVTIPHIHEMLKKHGRIRGWDLAAGKKVPGLHPHRFWDSDGTKWIEAAAYALDRKRDPALERLVDSFIRKMEKAQEPDGYLNMVGTLEGRKTHWKNLRDNHELYCAGHLVEAAVAYDKATGKDRLLKVALKFVEHIRDVMGPEKGKLRGYPGHPELEWALIRLYRHTGDKRHLELAAFFIDERGTEPHYYDIEAKARGEDPGQYHIERVSYTYIQAHKPVREQETAEGHAVRAVYLYTAMAGMVAHTGEKALKDACERLWRNIIERRMYVTGGIGSSKNNERFTVDYDLPNEQAYCETCAGIGLIFFAREMSRLYPDSQYADIIEKALFNAVLPGVSLSGDRYFYDNPLAVYPPYGTYARRWPHERYPWHGCACCPPNLARLVASIDDDFLESREGGLRINQFGSFRARSRAGGTRVGISCESDYPWDGDIRITVSPAKSASFTLELRNPAWNHDCQLLINGKRQKVEITDGYQRITREWKKGDTVSWQLSMRPAWLEAHPDVRHNSGSLALQRGPIVYCAESIDNPQLADLRVSRQSRLSFSMRTIDGHAYPTLSGKAHVRSRQVWRNQLYSDQPTPLRQVPFKATPFFMWGNRGPGSMRVWLTETL